LKQKQCLGIYVFRIENQKSKIKNQKPKPKPKPKIENVKLIKQICKHKGKAPTLELNFSLLSDY